MKIFVTVGLAFLSSVSMAGAVAHGVPSKPGLDATMAPQVMADASRVGAGNAAALDVLHPLPTGMRWSPDEPAQPSRSGAFSLADAPLEAGPLALLLGMLALLLTRPLGRVLRRQEQQRRAAALASAIAHAPRR